MKTQQRISRLTEATIAMALALVATAILATGCGKQGNAQSLEMYGDTAVAGKTAKGTMTMEEKVKRGEYLVTIGGCNDCHTPFKLGPNGPEPDMSRMLSGHPQDVKLADAPQIDMKGGWGWTGSATNTAFHGPWGTSYTMNLTADSIGGIGTWTEEIFINTIRSGKHWGTSRPIMPPMPWFNYAKATDEDLKSIYAYLRSIPVVRNTPPAYEPPSAPLADAGH